MMKKSMITFTVILMSLITVAETNNFKKDMQKALTTLRADDDKTNYFELGNSFAAIAVNNPNRVEPLYYSAYSYILASWELADPSEKAKMLEKSKSKIDEALKMEPNNDEILVLEAFYYQAMIMTNPQKYGQSYSIMASNLLNEAQNIKETNPRAQFLLAQNAYYTPAEYGGGKKVALPLFKKAADYYKSQDNSNYLSPVWGEATNTAMIQKCIK